MGPDTTQSWSHQSQDPQSPVTAMSGHLELLQRRILAANGLTILERDLLLSTLTAASTDLEKLARQLEGHARDRNQSSGGNGPGWPRA